MSWLAAIGWVIWEIVTNQIPLQQRRVQNSFAMGAKQSKSKCTDCFSVLPVEVTHRVTSFLLGVELIALAHASPALFPALNESSMWEQRIKPAACTEHVPRKTETPSWWCQEKTAYMSPRTLVFEGRKTRWVDHVSATRSFPIESFVALPYQLMHDLERFTIELTFTVAPNTPSSKYCHGGILIGFQSEARASTKIPVSTLALVSIDSNGGLRPVATDISAPTSVAAKITFGVWHCLVLAFDGRYLRAYLDGELRYFKRMPHGFNWHTLEHGQIGTGFGIDPNRTLATYNNRSTAWRPFHGLVASARVWRSVSDAEDARRLATGSYVVTQQPLYSLDTHETPGAARVLASHPCEQYVEPLRL